jgi:hypothetical protein
MEHKHSGIGVAAFVISIVMAVVAFGLITFAGVIEATTPGGMDEESALAVVTGLVDLVALGLGIGGLFQKDRKKIFPILGTIFSTLAIIGIVFVIVIGSMLE